MSDALVTRVLIDRGVALRDGTVYLLRYVAPRIYAGYPEIVAKVRDDMRREVARQADAYTDAVTLAEVTPAELDAAWREHEPMEPPPWPAHALVAYVSPRDVHGIPVGEHTATCGCRLRGRALLDPCDEHGRLITPVGPGEFSIGPFTAPRGTPCPR